MRGSLDVVLACLTAGGREREDNAVGILSERIIVRRAIADENDIVRSEIGDVGVVADIRIFREHRRTGGADRKSVVKGKSVSVRVDLGGPRINKKNKTAQQQSLECYSIYNKKCNKT